jgi:peptidoglycan/LPS O-acetylase OafA/YrhL
MITTIAPVQNKNIHNPNWVNGLDSLRFVLAIIVFLGHLQNEPALYLKSQGNALLRVIGIGLNHVYFGPGAVVCFFIISGFVIHYPNREIDFDWRVFMVRRWVRIALPLLGVVVFSVFTGTFYHIPIWSLYCELIYYSLYPLFRRSGLSWKKLFAISFVFAYLLIWVRATNEVSSLLNWKSINYTGSYAALGDGLTWMVGLPCWLLGVQLAERIDTYKHNVSTVEINLIRLMVLGLGVLVVAIKAHGFISFIFTLNWFAFFLVYWVRQEIIYFRRANSWSWLEYGGKFSYSLYLIHGIVVALTAIWLDISLGTYAYFILITIFASWIVYVVLENPSHHLAKYLARRVAKIG